MERVAQASGKYSPENTALPADMSPEEKARLEILRNEEAKYAAVDSELHSYENWARLRAEDAAVVELVTEGHMTDQVIRESIVATYTQFRTENVSHSLDIEEIIDSVLNQGTYTAPGTNGSVRYRKADIVALTQRAGVSNELVSYIDNLLVDEMSLNQLTAETHAKVEVSALRSALAIMREKSGAKDDKIEDLQQALDKAQNENVELHIERLEQAYDWNDKLLEDTASRGRKIDVSTLDTLKNPGIEYPDTTRASLVGAQAARSIVDLDDRTLPVKVHSISLHAD